MKKITFLFLCLVTVLFCVSFTTLAANDMDISVVVTAQNGEIIHLEPTDHVFYLPSAVDMTAVVFDFEGELSYSSKLSALNGKIQRGEALDLTGAADVDERGAPCYNIIFSQNGKGAHYVIYHDANLASLYVNTSRGRSYIESSKENRDKEAQITLLNADGDVEYSDITADTKSEIKSRGNATWDYYKKPYQIKLSSKTSLLGMKKSKTWILLAGYTDQSALHNALAFSLGDELEIPYNIQYRFVNLYIDGAYRGLYMICEKVQIDSSRVDIADLEKANEDANPDRELESFPMVTVENGAVISDTILEYYTYCEGMTSPEDITGGYLIELDNIRGTSEPCRFQTENGNIYVVKSPEFASREEMEYIATLFADLEEAIFSETGYNSKGIHYSEYIDMKSFAGIYTLQELLKNWDAYLSSMFFFKDADVDGARAKIYMGPLWDMDNTLGNINFNHDFGIDTAYLWAQDGKFNQYPREFAKKLMQHADFQTAVEKEYNTAYGKIQEYLAEDGWLAKNAEQITSSVMMDRTLWKLYDSNSWLLLASGVKTSVKFVHFKEYGTAQDDTDKTALGFLRYYLSSRAEALLTVIGAGEYIPPSTPETETTTAAPATGETTASQTTTDFDTPQNTSTPTESTSSQGTEDPTDEDQPSSLAIVFGVLGVVAIAAVLVVLFFMKKKKA